MIGGGRSNPPQTPQVSVLVKPTNHASLNSLVVPVLPPAGGLKPSSPRARGELGFKPPAGGKTGTTNEFKDAWFVGFTSTLTCGVWGGFDRPPPIMRRG